MQYEIVAEYYAEVVPFGTFGVRETTTAPGRAEWVAGEWYSREESFA
jgi:hypothetical protein